MVLVEPGSWVGGQISAQGVCTPDENAWVEQGGATAAYRRLREAARTHYRTRHRLSAVGAAQRYLNPGACWVSRVSAEPKVWDGLLRDMLATQDSIRVLHGAQPVECQMRGNRIVGVSVARDAGERVDFDPGMVLDATDTGELLPLCSAEFRLGAESRDETGEPDAPEEPRPDWVQPFTVPFALELRPIGEDHRIALPPRYEEMAAIQNYHVLDGAMRGMWGELGWWTYRRVIAAELFDDAAFPCDVAMINTASNDFRGATLPSGDSARDTEILRQARLASLGYVYWLQNNCPRTDGNGVGYPELRLSSDWFGTDDGLAPAPYIRESRRIVPLRPVLEQEIVAADSAGSVCQPGPRALHRADSVGIGHYWLDIHEGGTDEPGRFLETRPFQIPLGALVPVRLENLLPACKNIGVTHLTNGAFRLHPIEWAIGEAAGELAALCGERRVSPQDVWHSPALTRALQQRLVTGGAPIYWWGDVPAEHPDFARVQWLGMDGLAPQADRSLCYFTEG